MIPLVTSRLLPVPHGFTTRAGGVSEGPYASMNLGFSVGDDPDRVTENHRRLAGQLGITPGALRTVHQVHGDKVLVAPPAQAEALAPACGEADALITSQPGEAVGVKTADCVPLLLVDPDRRTVAAVHSGWRGTDARIAARAVQALVAQGARPERLLAAVGPCIQVCCYTVSADLGARFRERFDDPVVVEEDGQIHLDLPRAVRQTLVGAGLREAHIDLLIECTSCRGDRYYSHRRDRGLTGRHLNFALCRF